MSHVTPLPRERRVNTPSNSSSAGYVRRIAGERTARARAALIAYGVNVEADDVIHSVRTETGWTGTCHVWRTTIRLAGGLGANRERACEVAAAVGRGMDRTEHAVHSVYVDRVRTADGTYPLAIFGYSHDPAGVIKVFPRFGSLVGRVEFR